MTAPVQAWVKRRLGQVYIVTDWERRKQEFSPPRSFAPRTNTRGYREVGDKDTWSLTLLEKSPITSFPSRFRTSSIFHTRSDIIGSNPALKRQTYTSDDAFSWFDAELEGSRPVHRKLILL